jgi:tRNA/rRNA methyltransferase
VRTNRDLSRVQIDIEIREGRPVPVVAGRVVADIVRTCHDATVDAGLSALAVPDLTRETLEPVLIFCAERRCAASHATCAGCSRRMSEDGIDSFDAFVASHSEIAVPSRGISLAGSGHSRLTTDSLETLAKTWAGDDLWFFARRVLRKLRHGVRSHDAARPKTPAGMGKPAVILVEPQLPDNIGMVARAMANFGLEELRLIAPRDGWPNEKARTAASGATFIIDDAVAYPTYESALSDCNWICATTARQRDLAKPVMTPAQAVIEMRQRIAEGQRVGIVFGRERNGLETSEVAMADAIVMAPVDSRFASLNLAQSVLLLAYEWMNAAGGSTLGRVTTYETPRSTGFHDRGFGLADKAQLLGLFEHLEAELDRKGFFHPPEKRPTMTQNLRTMLTRLGASDQEIRTLRGVIKALVHGKGPGRLP